MVDEVRGGPVEAGHYRRSPYRILGIVAAAFVLLLAVLSLIVHTPPVRGAVLRYALSMVQQRYGLRLEADRLDYNLATLSVGLADLHLSAVGHDVPFFEADYVTVTLPRSAVFGELAFRAIGVTNGRINVVRDRDGNSNLPPSSTSATQDPPPLRLSDLTISPLAVDVEDAQNDLAIHMPAADVMLSDRRGRVAARRPVQVRVGSNSTQISQLEGEVAFDGRIITFDNLRARSDEASLRVDGRLTMLARESSFDVLVSGSGDIARLAKWGIAEGEVPRGSVAYQGRIWGPTDNPTADLWLQSPQISWQGLTVTRFAATTRSGRAALQLRQVDFEVAGGNVSAAAVIPLDTSSGGGVMASWRNIDAARLLSAVAPKAEMLPAGTLSGQLEVEGSPIAPEQWVGAGAVRIQAAANRRNRIAFPGESELRFDNGRVRVTGSHRFADAVPLTLAINSRMNEAAASRTAVSGNVHVEPAELPALLSTLRTTGLLEESQLDLASGTLEADAQVSGTVADPTIQSSARIRKLAGEQFSIGEAEVQFSGQPVQPRLAFSVTAPSITIADQPLSDVKSQGRLAGTEVTIESLSAAQPDAPGRFSGTADYDFNSERYNAAVQVLEWQLMPTVERPIAGRIDGELHGTGTVSQPAGEGTFTVLGAAWQGKVIGDVTAALHSDGNTLNVDAKVPDYGANIQARIGAGAPYPTTADVQVDNLDLSRALTGIETPTPITGTATFSAHGEGPLEMWRNGRATLEVASVDVTAGQLPIQLSDAARASYADRRVHVDQFKAVAGKTTFTVVGQLPMATPAIATAGDGLMVTATGDAGDILRAVTATGITEVPEATAQGPVTVQAMVTGSLEMPIFGGDLQAGPGTLTVNKLPSATDIRISAHLENDSIDLQSASATYQNAMLTASGKAPLALFRSSGTPSGGAMSLQAQIKGLTPAALEGIVDPSTIADLQGSIDASATLSGPSIDPAALAGEARLDRLDLRIADLPITQRVPTRIAIREGFARVEDWVWEGQGATLGLRGQVRLSDRQAALLANGQVDLRVLTPFVRSAGMTTAGRLEPRLSITGPLDNPRIDGDITVQDGQMRLLDPRVIVAGFTARAVLSGTTARITTLNGTINGGALTGDGEVEFAPGTPFTAQLATEIRSMALEFPTGLRNEINALLNLQLIGAHDEESASGRVAGTVNIVRGAYREPMAVATGFLTTLRARRLAAATAATPASPLLERLALDVRILTDEDLMVENNIAHLQIGGDLRLIGKAAAPALSGRAMLQEGGQLFVGRNVYTITSGVIDFANPVTIEPQLNIEAATRAGGEDIVVTLTGTPDALKHELKSTSTPELGEADLTFLLLTGRTIDQLEPGSAAFIGEQVIGNLSGEVLGFAGRAVGLDSVRLGGVEDAIRRDPTAIATADVDPASRLTFNKSIGTDVDVTFSQSLREPDAQTWIVDYLPSRHVQLRVVSDDEDLRSYAFLNEVTFGGPPKVSRGEESQRVRQTARVSAVTFRGNLVLPEARVRRVLKLKAGDRFDFGKWQTDRDRLEQFYWQQGRLATRIATSRMDGEKGVRLNYEVTAGPSTAVVVSGAELDRQVVDRVERAWAESVFDDFLVDEATEIVKGALAEDGFLRATVTVQMVSEADSRRLEVSIVPGDRSSSTVVRIQGIEPPLSTELETWLTSQKLIGRAVADREAVRTQATTWLHQQGYLGARVTIGAPAFEGDTAVVPLTVDPGTGVVVGAVTLDVGDSLPATRIREVVGLTGGSPYDPVLREEIRDRLVTLYGREGFPLATADIREATVGNVVDLTIAVNSGPRQVVGEVAIEGTRAIAGDVVTRAFRMSRGDALRTEDLLKGRTRIFDTGLFRRVDVSLDPLQQPSAGSATLPMRVRIGVEEWPAIRLRYGFQLAEEHPDGDLERRDLKPGVSSDVIRRTLFGRAISVGAVADYRHLDRRGRVFVTAPTLKGLPVLSSLVAERAHQDFRGQDRVTDTSAVSWEQRTRVFRNLSVSYAYSFKRDHTLTTSTNPLFPSFDITIDTARLTGTIARDTRDDPADAAQGTLFSAGLDYAPEVLGSDFRFVRYVARALFFRPWRNVVFASAVRSGAVRALGGQEVVFSELFFAGGATTLRGVAEDTLGRLGFAGRPVGGEAMLLLNQEVRFPIYQWLRGVGFIDAGNVFSKPRDVGLTDLTGSIGYGLRLATPYGIVRIDYGRRVWPGPVAPAGRWTFGIGQTF